jgi:hypothetical protein
LMYVGGNNPRYDVLLYSGHVANEVALFKHDVIQERTISSHDPCYKPHPRNRTSIYNKIV